MWFETLRLMRFEWFETLPLCQPRRRGTMLNLRIEVNVSQSEYGSGGLHLREEIDIREGDFLEMAKILGQFHDLAEKIKRERKP